MSIFATEFPVDGKCTIKDYHDIVVKWIAGSPHTILKLEDFEQVLNGKPLQKGNEYIENLFVLSNEESSGFRYTRKEELYEWITIIVFSKSKIGSWVGIRVECKSVHPEAKLPIVKKPLIVKQFLKKFGNVEDGLLPVTDKPFYLKDDQVDFAAQLIRGESSCQLPIVYISVGFDNEYTVDYESLAKKLMGMAHVVVEPNRPFSQRLRIDVESRNVYGGTVGLYWPEGKGRRSFFVGKTYDSQDEVLKAIFAEIKRALANKRAYERCTWAYLQELASRQEILRLQKSGSQELEAYISIFDKEIKAKAERLEEAEKEILRLKVDLGIYEERQQYSGNFLLKNGKEQDFYPNEIKSVILDSLKSFAERVPDDSRQKHILRDLIDVNSDFEDFSVEKRSKLKGIFKGKRKIDVNMRRSLEDMGFKIYDEGKHYKLIYQDDDRYTFTFPKSGSDSRGGLNAAGDISRLLFK